MRSCPACDAAALEPFYEVTGVPTNSCLLLTDATAARAYPRGDLHLAACEACGFICNTAFDPALTTYSADYEETQGFSPRFQDYIGELATHWVKQYDLLGKRVVALGWGQGEFLTELVRAGVGHGVGIDPGLHLDRIDPAVLDRTTWVQGTFPADYPLLDAAAVVCRHTLEHLAPVGEWLAQVRAAIGERTDTVVLFELPDTERILDEGAFWDVYYEHCSYFTARSLRALFERTGFEVLDLRRTFDEQYLVIEARPRTVPPRVPAADSNQPTRDGGADVLVAARRFAETQGDVMSRWRDRLRRSAAEHGRVVLWGASSKAVAFLAALGPDAAHVTAAVDINPHKHGHYLAGSGHPVLGPDDLIDLDPTDVVVMNPIYLTEITDDLTRKGLTARVSAL